MRWSKLKKLVEDSFADSVRGRVRVFSTHYDCSCGRGWITVDGKELANLCTETSGAKYRAVFHETTNTIYAKHPAVPDEERNPNNIVEPGEFSRFDLHIACWDYAHQSVADSLNSENPLIASLAVLNSKVGKGRLAKVAAKDLHPLTRALLNFRLKAEEAKSKTKEAVS